MQPGGPRQRFTTRFASAGAHALQAAPIDRQHIRTAAAPALELVVRGEDTAERIGVGGQFGQRPARGDGDRRA